MCNEMYFVLRLSETLHSCNSRALFIITCSKYVVYLKLSEFTELFFLFCKAATSKLQCITPAFNVTEQHNFREHLKKEKCKSSGLHLHPDFSEYP